MFAENLTNEKIYNDFDTFIEDSVSGTKLVKVYKYDHAKQEKRTIAYYNVASSFDIEASSFYQNGIKYACMYGWTFGINGLVYLGRTWYEFIELCRRIQEKLELNENKILIVYVHNLAFEFQFFRKYFKWINVFATDLRKPLYALCDFYIEFRCSYLLSGYSLEYIGNNFLNKYPVKKLMGFLDYEKIRHTETILTEKEKQYMVNDVKVVMSYIQEKIENENLKRITTIPLTKTGYVRKFIRKTCFTGLSGKSKFKRLHYIDLMQGMTLCSEEYELLHSAFLGGFTHASYFYSNKVMENVTSYDLTSAYPWALCSGQYPISKGEKIKITNRKQFFDNLNLYCCLFEIVIENVTSKVECESYISQSRCIKLIEPVLNNGRVYSAKLIFTVITEQDFYIIQKCYKWQHMKIGKFYRYKKGFLPTDFVLAVLKLYNDKTTLKGIEGKEVEYLCSKENLNSTYGMIVTNIIQPLIKYINDWPDNIEFPKIEEALKVYNENKNRFAFYPWGIWCTAYVRRRLWHAILNTNEDYIYSDTDSVKLLNNELHKDFFEKENKRVIENLVYIFNEHKIDLDLMCPKNKKGERKYLGVWEYEGNYEKFKTLGAKRYMIEKNGEINLTVSGINKKTAVPYLKEKYKTNDKIFEAFNDNMVVPAGYSGKMTMTYIDDETCGEMIDYKGEKAYFHELSSVHMENSGYELSLAQDYKDFLRNMILGDKDEALFFKAN